MSHGKQWSLETREFTSVNAYVSFVARDCHLSVCVHAGKFRVLLCFTALRMHKFYVQHMRMTVFACPNCVTPWSIDKKQVSHAAVWMRKMQAASSHVSFFLPAILFVKQLRPPVNAAAGLASFLALLLLISARHRDRQKEKVFSGRS